METRIYKDGAKTGKTRKLIIAGVLIGGVVSCSAYGLIHWHLPFIEVQTFTIVGIFTVGFFTLGQFKGMSFAQLFGLAIRYAVTTNQRNYKVERNRAYDANQETQLSHAKKGKKKKVR